MSYDMSDYARQAVDQYVKLTGQRPKHASTPICPEGSLTHDGECDRGELSGAACSLLMKQLWLARLSRPDLQQAICYLATHVTIWSRNDDKRVKRIIDYIYSTEEWRLHSYIADKPADLSLALYCDANFCGEHDDTKSVSGGILFLIGPNSLFPILWISKRQTSTSRSTTEAEVVAMANAIFGEGLPMLDLFELILGREKVSLEVMEDFHGFLDVWFESSF